ncbi:MAG: tryptophan--tRNA ligase [Anaerofustis sp.]
MFEQGKKTIFSGIQPSGEFTLGNYLGAIRNWAKLQDEYNCIYCIVDMHAITVLQEPALLRKRTLECTAMTLAAGIDPSRSLLYIQSHVPAHAELCWILNCYSYMGELSRMTQFKDKSAKQGDNIRVGLYDYPVLMAADILLYQTDLVPVGVDQKQHLELARDIAQRFNQQYTPTFKVPEVYLGDSGSKVMSLTEPTKKMSKSDDNANAYILMKDKKDVIVSKFKRAVTDSESEIRFDRENKPGVSNLLEIYSCINNMTIPQAEREFAGLTGYAELKSAVGEAVADCLVPIQSEFERILADKAYLNETLAKSSEYASYLAQKTLDKTKRKIGFYKLEK